MVCKRYAMRVVKVLFVCYGNICRSPIAEFVFRHMVSECGLENCIKTASCATSAEHIGDPVDYHSAKVLSKHGISCDGKTARRLNTRDFSDYDYIIGMDSNNLRYIRTMQPLDGCCITGKIMDYAGGGDVSDPWYTGNFDKTYSDIEKGCRGLLTSIRKKYGWYDETVC